jgi:hypothetical protein
VRRHGNTSVRSTTPTRLAPSRTKVLGDIGPGLRAYDSVPPTLDLDARPTYVHEYRGEPTVSRGQRVPAEKGLLALRLVTVGVARSSY